MSTSLKISTTWSEYLFVEEKRREKKTLKTVRSVSHGRLCELVSVYALLAKQETN